MQQRQKVSFAAHLQELIKLLEIIDERIKQAAQFVQFLRDLTLAKWDRLQDAILAELAGFRSKIEQALRSLLSK